MAELCAVDEKAVRAEARPVDVSEEEIAVEVDEIAAEEGFPNDVPVVEVPINWLVDGLVDEGAILDAVGLPASLAPPVGPGFTVVAAGGNVEPKLPAPEVDVKYSSKHV